MKHAAQSLISPALNAVVMAVFGLVIGGWLVDVKQRTDHVEKNQQRIVEFSNKQAERIKALEANLRSRR